MNAAAAAVLLHVDLFAERRRHGRAERARPLARSARIAGLAGTEARRQRRSAMFIGGADAGGKKTVAAICDEFGWDAEDMRAVEAARAIEPLCMLWCIPGVGKGDWSPHAFKLLR